jgi:hypothetical protein
MAARDYVTTFSTRLALRTLRLTSTTAAVALPQPFYFVLRVKAMVPKLRHRFMFCTKLDCLAYLTIANQCDGGDAEYRTLDAPRRT